MTMHHEAFSNLPAMHVAEEQIEGSSAMWAQIWADAGRERYKRFYQHEDSEVIPLEQLRKPNLLAHRGQSKAPFRGASCDQLNRTVDPRDDALVEQVAEKVDLAEPAPKPRIACLVYSYKEGRQDIRDSYATWGQDCDTFLPFSDETFFDKDAGFTTIEVHPKDGGERNLIGKVRQALEEVQRRVNDKKLNFDFLTISGDDSLWIISNLKKYLRENAEVVQKHNSNQGVLLGRAFSTAQPGQDFRDHVFPSGAGYVINTASLKAYLDQPPESLLVGWSEDVTIADALRQRNIPLIATGEQSGAQRFHPYNMQSMALVNYSNAGWLGNYTQFWSRADGLAGISKDSVLFHYEKGELRYQAHDLLYRKAACKQ
jgi:hypothetical protein